MVNKANQGKHKSQGTAAAANNEDVSYIVFGNDGNKKGKKASNSAPSTSNKFAQSIQGQQQDGPKKPNTRTLIAGASWTGKLPITLFNEHCQKQRWEKPEYTVRRIPAGYTSGVILRQKNPKTGEITALPPISLPRTYVDSGEGVCGTAAEAKHLAAAYALFRVGNMRNLSMALPQQYKDLWKGDFAQLKREAVEQGVGYLYEADPFLAAKRREEAKAKKEKDLAKKREVEPAKTNTPGAKLMGNARGGRNVPKIEMGEGTRKHVEKLVRTYGIWNPRGVHLSKDEQRDVAQKLVAHGFRSSHAKEAAEICANEEECVEWLLIHLPEDDMPDWALPDNYLAGIALASSDLVNENKVKRLAAAGYSRELCAEILTRCDGDETLAAFQLQARLIDSEVPPTEGVSESWDEEMSTLMAIYDERFNQENGSCKMQLELQTPSKQKITMVARRPANYPDALPALCIEASLPAYIKLSIIRQCLLATKKSFVEEMMIFNIIDWLEQNIPDIIEHPDSLKKLSAATSPFYRSNKVPDEEPPKTRTYPRPIEWIQNTVASSHMRNELHARQSTKQQQCMMRTRQSLPAWKMQNAITASVTSNQVTIISGETGSGKSTQSVQFVLDDMIQNGYGEQVNILCTQPRRVSALGLADRVAAERCQDVGDEVGYIIRGESRQTRGATKLTFMTTGILLRRLQTSGGNQEDLVRSLGDVSHVVIDEVHERSLDTDLLLMLLRDMLVRRKDLKLILMSATLDADVLQSYFDGVRVGRVDIPGRTFPVIDIYLDQVRQLTGYDLSFPEEEGSDLDNDLANGSVAARHKGKDSRPKLNNAPGHDGHYIDYDLTAQTVQYIDKELGSNAGGILIFLPGTMEIEKTLRALRGNTNLHALPLHAGLQTYDQRKVFARLPKGKRKVVAATNVAETSITIDDIVAVIDTGRVKQTSFDPTDNMVRLVEQWASKAECKQRRGRAGRVTEGKCYKLYTQRQETNMEDKPEPEITRVPLEQLCLSLKAMGIENVHNFLASALTPPDKLSISGALAQLVRIGALEKNELTALGRHLSMIPADLRCGKLLVYGAAFGCLNACLTIAATLTLKSPFVSPQTMRDEAKAAKNAFSPGNGDLLCALRAYEAWSRQQIDNKSNIRRWCEANFLSHQTLLDISTTRDQYLSSLEQIGFLDPGSKSIPSALNTHNESDALLRALVAGSFQPQIARISFPDTKYFATGSGTVALDPEARTIKFYNQENGRVFVHPSSTLFDAQTFPSHSAFLAYFTKVATTKVFIRDLCPFNAYTLLLFGGEVVVDPQGRGLMVDGWLRLRGWGRIGVLVNRLKMALDGLLARKVDDPQFEMCESEVVSLVRKMVTFDGLDR
ncbi:P-loop containing nucleoside triphosphate hydrolase protein [Piedraia hortae CBS 480.64]|uniref:RNA helicase n=1 Tax=Piedraia hortae CBS 480.64 TaxID=1314780 RepID=A0A6A7C728_9PEZI|nr:P-loop containing nucleoside triphosphate hydrolase protein [Piedraia hortae CBS 480.64]